MGTLLTYSIIVGFTLIPLYLIIKLCLSRHTFFRLNRIVILCSYLIALSMPLLLNISGTFLHDAALHSGGILIGSPQAATVIDNDATSSTSPYLTVMLVVYIMGLVFFIAKDATT